MTDSSRGVAVVIPARYGASRLPGKPLAQIDGRPMIWYVWENARNSKCATRVIVATDDERVAGAVYGFGGEARMTSSACVSGTDRVAETARELSEEIRITSYNVCYTKLLRSGSPGSPSSWVGNGRGG